MNEQQTRLVRHTQAQAEQLGAYQDNATPLADALKATEPPKPENDFESAPGDFQSGPV